MKSFSISTQECYSSGQFPAIRETGVETLGAFLLSVLADRRQQDGNKTPFFALHCLINPDTFS